MSRQSLVQEAWGRVSRLSGIPQVNLDALLWVLGGALIYSGFNVEEALRKLPRGVLRMQDKVQAYRRLMIELSVNCVSKGAGVGPLVNVELLIVGGGLLAHSYPGRLP
jgi:Domain of unknown function (DUF1886).